MRQVERGQRIPQPRLRHRFQRDLVGLTKRRQRLIGEHESLRFEFDESGPAAPDGARRGVRRRVSSRASARTDVMELIRRAMRWQGPMGPRSSLRSWGEARGRGWSVRSPIPSRGPASPSGSPPKTSPRRDLVQRQFRLLLREAHPDSGGDEDVAARRISELSEARRILLLG